VNDRWWNNDDELFGVLADALREERDVPAHFVEAGKAVFVWHSIDAELAALTYDSLIDALPAAATRAPRAAIRELTFLSRELKIHIQVSATSLHGQIVPAQRGEIEVHRTDHSPQVIEIDEQGWFTIAQIPRVSFRLLCRTQGGMSALTDWLSV
jgi:hypothetical protein